MTALRADTSLSEGGEGIRIPTPVCGGAHGPRPTGCGGHTGRTESSAPTKQNKNRAKRDVEDAVPYGVQGRDGERWGKMFTLAALTLGNYYCIIN